MSNLELANELMLHLQKKHCSNISIRVALSAVEWMKEHNKNGLTRLLRRASRWMYLPESDESLRPEYLRDLYAVDRALAKKKGKK